jgi:type IV secretion system protein VirD4
MGSAKASAIWDSAITKLIMGGGGNSDDLRDLSALIGTKSETQLNESWGADGRRSVSSSAAESAILDPGRLRTLPFGTCILLLRSAPPILLALCKWTDRQDVPSFPLWRVGGRESVARGREEGRGRPLDQQTDLHC